MTTNIFQTISTASPPEKNDDADTTDQKSEPITAASPTDKLSDNKKNEDDIDDSLLDD